MQQQCKYIYQHPKKRFGEILNANQVTPRDINKDLMMKTQQKSEVRNFSKQYYFQKPNTLVNHSIPKIKIQKY